MDGLIKLPQLPFLTREMLQYGSISKLQLRIKVYSLTGITATISGLTRSGVISMKIPVSAGGKKTEIQGIDDIPIFLSAYNTAGGSHGNTYVIADLIINDSIIINLMQGYISLVNNLTYPINPYIPQSANKGAEMEYFSDDPAAGNEITFAGSLKDQYIIHYAQVTLVTDANVANRRVHFRFSKSGDCFFETFSDQDQAASLTRKYSLAPYGFIPDSIDDNDILVPIPPNLLMSSDNTIDTMTTNLQAADNFGRLYVKAERWAIPSLF